VAHTAARAFAGFVTTQDHGLPEFLLVFTKAS